MRRQRPSLAEARKRQRFAPTLLLGTALVAATALLAQARAAECDIKLGAMGPMAGPAAQWGLAMLGAAQLAAAEVNAEGGLQVGAEKCHVTVLSYDSKYTAEGAAAGANSLASQGVKFIIGPVGSPEVTGIKPVASRNNLLVFGDSYAKNAIGPQWPLVFHLGPGVPAWGPAIVKKAKEIFHLKTVAIIAPNDQAGTDIAEAASVAYKGEGITSTENYYQRGTTDFSPIITRLLASHPDAVDTASSPPGDAGIIVKQLRQAGFQGAIGRLGGPGTSEIIRVAGGIDVLKNFYCYETVPVGDPKVKALGPLYRKLLNAEPPENDNFALWLPGARMTLKAISKAGTATDTKKVAEALRAMTPEDPTLGKGKWTGQDYFGINQELFFSFGVGLIVNGKDVSAEQATASN